jgi:hypothetical protein
MKWSEMTAAERSAEMKRRQAVAKANGRGGKRGKRKYSRKEKEDASSPQAELEKHTWYLFGKVETILDLYSASAGIPRAALTRGLARLLRD